MATGQASHSRFPHPKAKGRATVEVSVHGRGQQRARVGPNDPEYLLRLLMPFLSATKSLVGVANGTYPGSLVITDGKYSKVAFLNVCYN